MNIQIFGKGKCFDTKKTIRYFKERNIKFQEIDIVKYGLSDGELNSVIKAVGSFDDLVDTDSKDYCHVKYLAQEEQRREKLKDNPKLFKTPIVRNGKQATVGYKPQDWAMWE